MTAKSYVFRYEYRVNDRYEHKTNVKGGTHKTSWTPTLVLPSSTSIKIGSLNDKLARSITCRFNGKRIIRTRHEIDYYEIWF